MTIKEIAKYVMEKYPESAFGEEALRGHIDMDDEGWLTEMLAEFFAYDILHLCGCGNPEDTWDVIRRVLRIRSKAREASYDGVKQMYKDELHLDNDDDVDHGILQFILYILDHCKLVAHGSSVGGCYVTEFGNMCLTVFDAWFELEACEEG